MLKHIFCGVHCISVIALRVHFQSILLILSQPPCQQKGLLPADTGLKSPRLVTSPLYFKAKFIKDKILHDTYRYIQFM